MPKNLLIVESPTKVKTLKKYLGREFEIMASVGHVKDLPVNRLGVDIENDFRPEYVVIKGKAKVLKALKEAGKRADAIYLGPDPDREGEAIAWHIAEELNGRKKKIYRVLFNELTPKAIQEAVASPQGLNREKYESQQARRILDRLVGYQISPLLWTRVKRGLSAGRVQSVALKMICDREREIFNFEPQEYWSLTAHLHADEPPPFKARLSKWEDQKADLKNEAQVKTIVEALRNEPFKVLKVSKRKKRRTPPPPFITSQLQQEAYRRLGFSAKKSMSIAQNLYEGVELGEKGQVGLITYMRTDSFRLSDEAVSLVRSYIHEIYGPEYLPEKPNRFRSPKGAQEAHEAIRPTSIELSPDAVAPFLSKDQLALYTLIWRRFVACQMAPALYQQTQADIEAGKGLFKASGSVMVFKGFTVVYDEEEAEATVAKSEEGLLPPLRKDQVLTLKELEPAQHFTQPPPRFTEATLIKALEDNGIGRPSTYATIISNINQRAYVTLEKGRFRPTELGFLVTDLLVKGFPEIMDVRFTAQMEGDLDKIERGQVGWTRVLKKFYSTFQKDLEKAKKEMKGEVSAGMTCPKCGRPLVIKSGRNGLFLACSGYPECNHTANFERDEKGQIIVEKPPEVSESEIICEKCGRPMVAKRGRFGPFLACSGYPECKNTKSLNGETPDNGQPPPDQTVCKVCGGKMLVKINKRGQRFLACENYPKCTNTEPLSTGVPCPQEGCPGTLVERASKRGKKFYACNQYPKCRFILWDEPVDEVCPLCGTKVLVRRDSKDGGAYLICRNKECDFKRPLEPSSGE